MNLDLNANNLESTLFDLIDQIRLIFSQQIWENILLNCSKNELLVLMLLYRQSDINMTQIADYLNAPLNTTTGIVTRMEKKDMIQRVRNDQDKRVVTIVLTDFGRKQVAEIMGMVLTYGQEVILTLSADEIATVTKVITKVVETIQRRQSSPSTPDKKIRKITIE